ncbi:uncharacterized protein LOC110036761 [Phalaenopsis equestris]|uniref:uncharacterized protein LOC110036761 n=1 Tax=Phalaenopsis equestris TaxID=78828 RepID=UPI0009E5D3FC|nr:uncharacterized protein LOC110036761 [Phalaenopsis equestris]
MSGSDHRPILCSIQNAVKHGGSPFRFQNIWTLHPNFIKEVTNAWTINEDYGPSINLWKLQKKVALHLKSWNWNTFGDFKEFKNCSKSAFLKQKAVFTKFTEGDKNSSFFHACINFRRKCNMILEIKNSEGIKLTKAEDIVLDAVKFFQQLFNSHPTTRTIVDANLFADETDNVSRLTLDQIPFEDEIRAALDSIDDDKTAGPDGYTAKPYKSC